MKTQARLNVPRVRPSAFRRLSAEQLLCFLATCDDLRAVGADGRATNDAMGRLLAAFSRGARSDWRMAVHAIDHLVTTAPASAGPFALRRLGQFVGENTDLLGA